MSHLILDLALTPSHTKAATSLISFLLFGRFKVYSRWTHGGLHHRAPTWTKDGLYIRLVQHLAAVSVSDVLRCQIGRQGCTLRTRLRELAEAEVKKKTKNKKSALSSVNVAFKGISFEEMILSL